MNTKDLLETLNRCQFHQKYQKARNIGKIVEHKIKKPVNWVEREEMKNKLFKKYIIFFISGILAVILFMIVPFWLVYKPVANGLILGMPPMIFMASSWMIAAWWAWDRPRYIFISLTMGMIPVRLTVGIIWAVMAIAVPDISVEALVISMMACWILFTAIEIAMIQEFSNKLEPITETKND